MSKFKVVWLSRHEMTGEQLADLADFLNRPIEELEVEKINHTWQATDDAGSDHAHNKADWQLFFRRLSRNRGCVVGVFPPVALSVLRKGTRSNWWRILSPVSVADPAARKDPSAPIPFRHLRFVEL